MLCSNKNIVFIDKHFLKQIFVSVSKASNLLILSKKLFVILKNLASLT